MRWKAMAAVLALGTGSLAAHAQPAADHALIEAAQAQILEIERADDGTIGGEGWEQLIRDGAVAQFFLVGEQHATANIAHVAAALQARLARHGYDYMAVEVGPWSTRYAEQLIRAGTGVLREFLSAPGNGLSLPFLFFAEESALAEQAVAGSPVPSDALWGLDQEFIAAGPALVPVFERLVRTDAQRAAVEEFRAAVASNFMLIGAGEPAAFAGLRAAFDTGEDAEALALVDALLLSNQIYGPFTRDTGPIYPANLARENYMKRNFLDHFARAEGRDGRPPRVFLKFGGNHLARGRSSTNVPALGDFLVEWGRARDFGVVNILIDCAGGSQVDVRSGAAVPCESYALEDDALLTPLVGQRPMTLIDLRPLRPLIRGSTAIDDASRDLIFAYDYYLAIADVSPAHLVSAQTP